MRFFLSTFFISASLFGEISPIGNLSSIKEFIREDDLLILTVDYLLTEPKDPSFSLKSLQDHRNIWKKLLLPLPEEEKNLLPSFIATYSDRVLCEPGTPALVKELQEQNIPIFAFTTLDTALLNDRGTGSSWRFSELQSFGLSFAHSDLPKKRVEFGEFAPFRGSYPLYENGILYTNVTASQASLLTAFLPHLTKKPARIIFVGENLDTLISIEEELNKEEIAFLGLHYTPEDDSPAISSEKFSKGVKKVIERVKTASFPRGVVETENATTIAWALSNAPPDSLIVFDVGDVLVMQRETSPHYRPRQESQNLRHLFKRGTAFSLVNPLLAKLITERRSDDKFMVLSRYLVGQEAEIEATLKDVGIAFGNPFPEMNHWFSKQDQTSFSRGILVTMQPLKGPVLKKFLSQIAFQPKAIVFIDDQREQCESVLKTTKELGIPGFIIQYTESRKETP